MASRTRVFDRFGNQLTDLEVTVTREWVMSRSGKATFIISRYDPKCTEQFLRYGNYLLVENDTLPAWGGMIDTPRAWKTDGVLVTAYSNAYMYKYRVMQVDHPGKMDSGATFIDMINKANDTEDTRIRAGYAYSDGNSRKVVYKWQTFYDILTGLVNDTKCEYIVEPVIDDDGKIIFIASWYLKTGSVNNYLLTEGENVELSDESLNEQGMIYNDYIAYTDGSTKDTKKSFKSSDTVSIQKYGTRQGREQFTGDNEWNLLDHKSEAAVNKYREPRGIHTLNVLNVASTFERIRLGDTLQLALTSSGFYDNSTFGKRSTIRILGFSYSDDTENVLKLVCNGEADTI